MAGSRAVTELRNNGFTGEIYFFSAEPHDPYDRPPLSKELFTRTEPALLATEVGADIHAADLKLHLDEEVLGAAHVENTWVITTNARVVTIDAVIAASGAYALRPANWEGALTLHTLDDATGLRNALKPGGSLLCVGAGWIGAEIATVAAAQGCDVTVVEAGATPLVSALGEVGSLTTPWYEEAGVTLRLNSPVASTTATSVTLTSGETLEADAVLAAVGVAPHTEWLQETGVDMTASGHVLVDNTQRTSLPNLWAVGDCTTRKSAVHGEVVGGHWDGALQDPARAVASLLGNDIPAEPAPYVFSTQLGHEVSLFGSPQHSSRWVMRGDTSDDSWGVLWFTNKDTAPEGTAELVAVFSVDRPRDTADSRKLLAGGPLLVDEAVATDASRRLRDARAPKPE